VVRPRRRGFIFTTWQETVKAANLQRDGRVRFCVDNEVTLFAFVLVEGTADVADGAEDLLYWASRIAGRYIGANQAEEYGRRNGAPGELLVRVITAKVVAKKNVSD
jgi:pyridoxine/pyridoxamine 5'-phosphate oxidase